MKRWYQQASARAPNLSQTDMEKVREDFQNLYHMEYPHKPGLPLATHVGPAKVNDEVPSEAEVEAAVRRLRQHREGGHTHFHAEHFKQWRRETYPGEQSKTPPRRDCCLCLVDIVLHMWRMGEIP